METDVSLKVLSRKYTSDLLRLVHEEGVSVLSVDAIELHDVSRRVDCLIKLQGRRRVYYRHFEFQSEAHPDMARRCFRYNTQLVLQLDAPVLTTVVYLTPPGERNPEALAILAYFAGAYYNVEQLTRLFGRETMIQSSVWQAAWSEGKAEGRVEGILAEQRALCLELIKLHHPGLSAKAAAAVQACSEPAALRTWILKATQLDDPAFARLLGIG